MSEPGPIFICYAGRDRAIAERLHHALREAGLMPWCDAIDMHADERWDEVIPAVLARARIAAVLVSHHWPVAGQTADGHYGPEEVARAIAHARRQGTKLVPIRLDGVGEDRVPFGLFRVKGVDARSDALGPAVHAIRRIAERDGGTSPPPADPLARAMARLRQLTERGASSEALAALRGRILDLKRGRLHRQRPTAGQVLDRWILTRRLGRGGFGEVWAADDVDSGAPVALKILHAQFDDSAERRARFFRGARRMAALNHPHIVRVIEPEVTADGRHFFVMERMAGDLETAVIDGLGPHAGLDCIARVADAVAAAHAAGMVHRDIKPANILLDAAGRPRLGDFDLVRAADTTGGTRTGALGTFVYAAPEAMEDASRVDGRCDVYGLGMTALFVLYGKPLPRKVLKDPRRVLRRVLGFPAVGEEILRAIEWEPDQRHPSAADFAASLRRALAADQAIDELTTDARPDPGGHAEPERVHDPATMATPPPGSVLVPGTVCRPGLVYIPEGRFWMGSPSHEAGRQPGEAMHPVELSRPLLMAATPVTIGQRRALMRDLGDGVYEVPALGVRQSAPDETRDLPAVQISWRLAVAYCNTLSDREGLRRAYVGEGDDIEWVPGSDGYRLPTEAEWEYACRAGTVSRFWSGDEDRSMDAIGWHRGNSGNRLQSVAGKACNPWGLYDMHGLVWEWCHDRFAAYPGIDTRWRLDPIGPRHGTERVLRGGGFSDPADGCRAARRSALDPDYGGGDIGFRIVRPA